MAQSFRSALAILVAAPLALACAVAPREGVHSATPVEAVVGAGMAANEIAKSKAEEVVFGSRLSIIGDRAHFFQCATEERCSERPVDLPASAVLGVKVVGRARPVRDDGSLAEETDVLRVTIARGVTTSRGGVAIDPNRGLTVGGPTK